MSPDNGKTGEAAPEPKLLNIRQVAKALNVSDKTVWRRIERRELAARRIGRHVKVRPEDLDAYVASLPEYEPRSAVAS